MDKHEALQQYFGHATFRDGQEEVVDAILQGRDVLGIMPTGAGKSVCYQLSAMLLSGLTIVISPLISLMKDQVDSLLEIGISAAYLNSSMDAGEYQVTMLQARQGIYRILYVAPERLQTEGFLSFAEQAEISMVTVDEAHCVSQWGQDFRQSYLGIAEFLNKLPKRPIVSAFTATAGLQGHLSPVAVARPVSDYNRFRPKKLVFCCPNSSQQGTGTVGTVAGTAGKEWDCLLFGTKNRGRTLQSAL